MKDAFNDQIGYFTVVVRSASGSYASQSEIKRCFGTTSKISTHAMYLLGTCRDDSDLHLSPFHLSIAILDSSHFRERCR